LFLSDAFSDVGTQSMNPALTCLTKTYFLVHGEANTSSSYIFSFVLKGKGKVHPRTGHEGLKGE